MSFKLKYKYKILKYIIVSDVAYIYILYSPCIEEYVGWLALESHLLSFFEMPGVFLKKSRAF